VGGSSAIEDDEVGGDRKEGIMKVAVTSQGESMDSPVDPRFGRAKFFIVVDTESNEFDVVDNEQNVNAPQGAGIQAAETVARQDVEYVLTGHCGPKAFHALGAAGIKVVVGLQGTVKEAIDSFKAGDLTPTDAADVEGHWT